MWLVYLWMAGLVIAPWYARSFNLFGQPINLLFVYVSIVVTVFCLWLVATQRWLQFLLWLRGQLRLPSMTVALVFFLSGLVAVFVAGDDTQKWAQWVVLFLQPAATFICFRYIVETVGKGRAYPAFAWTLLWFLALSGAYAVFQYLTLIGVPPGWWGNGVEPKRALAFFSHPNFYALFAVPLLAFALPFTGERLQAKGGIYPLIVWFLAVAGVFLSLSRGAWLGLAAMLLVYLLCLGSKRMWTLAVVAVCVTGLVVFAVPNLRYRLLLPFYGEKSTVSRASLWQTASKEIVASPVLGQGLLGFSRNWDKYNTDPGLAHHPTPHNLYLALWVDTGLLGLLSFLIICIIALRRGLSKKSSIAQLGVALAVVAILAHGLVDTPYLKNDLAFVFWLLMAFV